MAGQLLRRALDLKYALKTDVTISMDEIPADEFWALRVINGKQECRAELWRADEPAAV